MQKKHETRQINCTLCPNIQEKLENQKISGITGVISLNDFSPLYFKDQQENDKWTECFDSEGWLHTGDLGIIDADDFIYIRGRCKNMLLGPSGQNIYPEEMEAKLNNQPFVLECVIKKACRNSSGFFIDML